MAHQKFEISNEYILLYIPITSWYHFHFNFLFPGGCYTFHDLDKKLYLRVRSE
jgi:hypothetical protein